MPIDIVVMKAVSADNDLRAAEVQQQLNEHHVLGLNLMSSPGSGKTALLEATIQRLGAELRFGVIEGDVYTAADAERIARLNVPVVQLNTEGSCHLTAHMILEVLPRFDLSGLDVLAIENIGNLICPAAYTLGEHKRIACLSTAEGADKADKYPRLFSISQANVITKTDLAEHVDFDAARVTATLTALNPVAPVFATSVKRGEGLEAWCNWLESACAEVA